MRTALNYLLSWGWLDRSQHVANGLWHYCLTRGFAATVGKAENEELYRAILDRLPERFNRDEAVADKKTDVANADLRQGLQAVSQSQLIQRIFELNRIQRHCYNKGTLRNLCTILHWFLQEEASVRKIQSACLCGHSPNRRAWFSGRRSDPATSSPPGVS
ncbi:MAG: hypothetical protein ACREXM_11215 [Gammaproteobacteria bacterium]